MKKNFITYIVILLANLISLVANAQVGVNTNKPNVFSILELKSDKKGILFPRLTTSERFAIKTACMADTCPDGLMVYDTDIQAFFYMVNKNWFMMNPFLAPDITQSTTESTNLNTAIAQNVGIGTPPSTGNRLDVNGKVQISSTTNLKNALSVRNGVTVNTGNVVVETGNVNIALGNANAPVGVIEGKTFTTDITKPGNGVAPKGAIIIWSGTIASIPAGWGLCDGTQGTPDLQGRFVVGHASTDNTNVPGGAYSLGNKDGDEFVTLTEAQMPAHNHTATTNTTGSHSHKFRGYETPVYYTCAGSDDFWCLNRGGGSDLYGGEPGGAHTHTLVIDKNGGGKKHENRPPYYALAFIMKL